MEELEPDPPTPQLRPASFLALPSELRNTVYGMIIQEATISTSPPIWLTSLEVRAAFHYNIQISSKSVHHPKLRNPSNFIYTCKRVYAEFNSLLYSRIHSMQLSGDFLFGLSPTAAIFDMLARRPWIAQSVRTVNVDLKLDHVMPVIGGAAINYRVLRRHRWLGKRLRRAEVRVLRFETTERGKEWLPKGWVRSVIAPRGSLDRGLERMGLKGLAQKYESDFCSGEEGEGWKKGRERNTLPDLARLFLVFPVLERVDLETEHRYVLSLFPPLREVAESFKALDERGVGVSIVVKSGQTNPLVDMLSRNGMKRTDVRLDHALRDGKTIWRFCLSAGGMAG